MLRAGAPATERIATPDSLLTILRKNLDKLPRPAAAIKQASSPASGKVAGSTATKGNRDGRFIIEGGGRPVGAENSVGINQIDELPDAYFVQVAAFSNKARAETLAKKIGARVMTDGTRSIWRVRYGPFLSEQEAQAGLAQAAQRGYSGARILRADK